MKKIIALAVAGAFVVPAYAADITMSGEIEYMFQKYESDGVSGAVGDEDVQITATEEANGVAITGFVRINDGTAVGALSLGGEFGTVEVGSDTGTASEAIDEVAGVAEWELGDSASAATTAEAVTARYTLPTLVDGLVIKASYGAGAGTNDAADTNEFVVTSYALQYTVGMVTLGYATIDDEQTPTYDTSLMNAKMVTGPITLAYEQTANDGALNTDISAIGAVYNYGGGNVFVEAQTTDTNGVETNDSAVGVSYKIGGVNMYIQSNSGDTVADNGKVIGVEYAF
ncbi:hypothetical protein OAM79_04505 [Litorivicinus sp.]|nr:hypothetical protein [Litorivicinus sp.]